MAVWSLGRMTAEVFFGKQGGGEPEAEDADGPDHKDSCMLYFVFYLVSFFKWLLNAFSVMRE